jgi:YggT family protein
VTVLFQLIGALMYVLAFAIFARAILSWFPVDRSGPLVQALNAITDPVLEPLRRVIPPIGMIDITPMVAMITLFIVSNMLMAAAQ